MGFQKDVYGISFGFLWCFCGISMGFLWDVHDISFGFLWYVYEITIGLKTKSRGLLWDWEVSTCFISQNIGCLINTKIKKTALKQIFKGVVHEQPWSSIVCLLWWSSIVSSFFMEVTKAKSFSPFLFLSFANMFLFYFLSSILLELEEKNKSFSPFLFLSFTDTFHFFTFLAPFF